MNGSVILPRSGGGGGAGTVTSVDLTMPDWFSVSGNPITTAGTIAVTAATGKTANQVLATPNGSTGALGIRSLVGADLPFPSLTTIGGVKSKAAVSHNFLTQIGTDGVIAAAQPAFSDISGSVAATQLPNPSATTLGGVQSKAAVSHNFLTQIGTDGSVSQAQPAFSDISGSVAAFQLPNPSSSTLGGIQSAAAVTNQWINSISTSGVPSLSQPAFTDISGAATVAQLPTVTIAKGGTGQVTKAPAFDALAPTTTKGDLIVFNGTNNVRQAKGTDGYVVTYDSTSSTGIGSNGDSGGRTRFGIAGSSGATFIYDAGSGNSAELSLAGNGGTQFELINNVSGQTVFKQGGATKFSYDVSTGDIYPAAKIITGGNNNQIRVRKTVNTTDATATNIGVVVDYSVFTENVTFWHVQTLARRTDSTSNTNFATFYQIFTVVMHSGILILQQTDTPATYNPNSIPAPTLVIVSNNTIQMKVTGVAAQTWAWAQSITSYTQNGDLN